MDFLPFADGGLSGMAMAGTLAVLALIDSTSFGTLLIPVWLLMAPGRLQPGRVLLFLGTVAGFYFAVGMAIMLGAEAFVDRFGAALASRPAYLVQLVLGLVFFAWSFRLDSPASKRRAAEAVAGGGGRISRWRARAMGVDGDPRSTSTQTSTGDVAGLGATTAVRSRTRSWMPLMALALTAAALEVATMIPYLAGIGIISTQGPGWPASTLWLMGYCLVMVLPALVLLGGRLVAADLLRGPLGRLDGWLTRHAASTTAWVIGAVGFFLALNAVGSLGWM